MSYSKLQQREALRGKKYLRYVDITLYNHDFCISLGILGFGDECFVAQIGMILELLKSMNAP
jgi:hypothetical protein